MAAPSSEGPAALLAEELLWSAGFCCIDLPHHHLLVAVKAPGMTPTSLVKLDHIILLMTNPIMEVKDVLLPSRPDGAFPKEKATLDAMAPWAKKVVARARSESRRERASASSPQRLGPQKHGSSCWGLGLR